MKTKLIKIPFITLILLGLLLPNFSLNLSTNQIQAAEETTQEPKFPLVPSMLGRIEATGTYFETKDSEYLNITLKSNEEIKVILESIPRMISIDISSSTNSTFTNLTLEGLEPNKTYYKYQDSYKNGAVFVSDENGNYSWLQDLEKSHHIWLQEEKGTIFLPDDCSKYGIWNTTTQTCTLTQDLTGSVEITQNNITLDGNGHTITGNNTGFGVYLRRPNVTIKNLDIKRFSYGIFFFETGFNRLSNNNILNNQYGVYLYQSEYNKISDNTTSYNYIGFFLDWSDTNVLSNNTASNNWVGIWLIVSANNTLSNNTMNKNKYNFALWGERDSQFNNQIDTSNLIDGRPIYFIKDAKDTVYDSSTNAGTFFCIRCVNVTLKDMNLYNNAVGLYLWRTTSSTIQNVSSSANAVGILLEFSSYNILAGNNVSNNGSGISLQFSSSSNILRDNNINLNHYGIEISGTYPNENNKIFHNNIINNKYQAVDYGKNNLWYNDYPSGGNYWSDYAGKDEKSGPNQDQSGSDGIGDTPYTFTDSQDRYPFIRESGWKAPALDIAVSDEPDPFTPPYQSSAITIGNKSGVPLEKITLSIEDADRHWEWLNIDPSADVQAVWDGKDGAGNFVSESVYNYTATGCLFSDCQGLKITKTGTITVVYPDFSITAVKPVQVVWDSHVDDNDTIDLVAGKATMVRIQIWMENYDAAPGDLPVEVKLNFEGKDYYAIPTPTIEKLKQNSKVDIYTDPPVLLGDLAGDQTIVAKVDPQNKIIEFDENNNEDSSTKITVKNTNGLYLVYFPIDRGTLSSVFPDPCCYGPIDMDAYQKTVDESAKFIKATYPVAGGKFNYRREDDKIYGDAVPFFGMYSDAINLKIKGELLTHTLVDRIIGIVPDDYFSHHFLNSNDPPIGINLPSQRTVALVENKDWTTAAHELGHSYGLHLKWPEGPGEEYETNPPSGKPASGFWVEKEDEPKEIYPYEGNKGEGGLCFMGSPWTPESFSYDPDGRKPVWVDNEDYTALFKKLRINETDPDVLLINGFIFKDGKIRLGKMFMVKNGVSDNDITPGDYSIRISDKDGQLLEDIPFKAIFEKYTDVNGIEKEFTSFAFVIPFPGNASKIQIQGNGQNLMQFNPDSRLLSDAIDSIPDYGFVNNPEQRRNALHNKINEVERMIGAGDARSAIQKLDHDVKDKLEKWLVFGYQKGQIEQYNKDEVISLLAEIVDRLGKM